MEGFWQSPEVQGGVIPFAAALVLALAIRVLLGPRLGGRLAFLGAAIGFLIAYWILEGVAWPAVSAKQKVFWLAALAIILGLVMELRGGGRIGTLMVAHLFPVVALCWLAWRIFERGPSGDDILKVVALYVGSVVVIWMLTTATLARAGETRVGCGRINAPALLMIGGFAGGAISLYGAEIGMAQLSIAIGAVIGGVLLLSYLLYIFTGEALKFGAVGVIGVAGAWLTSVYVMVLYGSSVSYLALGILLLTFLLNIAARHVRFGDGRAARVVEPILYGAIVAIPAVVAVVYVLMTAEPESGY